MKAIEFSPDVHKKLKQLHQKNPKFYCRIIKQLDLFQQDPKHKSLRLHKISRDKDKIWSISIDKGYRMLYLEDERIYFFEIGTHDEVYRKR